MTENPSVENLEQNTDQIVNDPPKVETDSETKTESKPRLQGSDFYKQKIQSIEEENARLKRERDDQITENLKQKENFKGLYELEKKKREEAEGKAKHVAQSYFDGLKTTSIEQEAIKAGILDVALDDIKMLDSDGIVDIETTSTGRANVLGAKEFVESLKERKPHWFRKDGAPTINRGVPGDYQKAKVLTPDEMVQLQQKDPQKYEAEMRKRLNLA